MQLKGLESLSVLKKQMEQENKKMEQNKVSSKVVAPAEELQRKEQAEFERKEHKAQLKAAKKSYKEAASKEFTSLSQLENLSVKPDHNRKDNVEDLNMPSGNSRHSTYYTTKSNKKRKKEENRLLAEQQRKAAEERREAKRLQVLRELEEARIRNARSKDEEGHKAKELEEKRRKESEERRKKQKEQVRINENYRNVSGFDNSDSIHWQTAPVHKEPIKKNKSNPIKMESKVTKEENMVFDALEFMRQMERDGFVKTTAANTYLSQEEFKARRRKEEEKYAISEAREEKRREELRKRDEEAKARLAEKERARIEAEKKKKEDEEEAIFWAEILLKDADDETAEIAEPKEDMLKKLQILEGLESKALENLEKKQNEKKSVEDRILIVEEEIKDGEQAIKHIAETDRTSYNQIRAISSSINSHYTKEKQNHVNIHAIARAEYGFYSYTDRYKVGMCWVVNYLPQRYMKSYYVDQYGLVHAEFDDESPNLKYLDSDGMTISKNTRKGEAIIRFRPCADNPENILNRAAWNIVNGINNITINIAQDEKDYTFQNLAALTKQFSYDKAQLDAKLKFKEELEEKKKSLLEQIGEAQKEAKEASEKRKVAEDAIAKADDISEKRKAEAEKIRQLEREKEEKEKAERLKAEAERQAKEEKELRIQLEELKKKTNDDIQKIETARSFIRQDNSLRSQHFLDDFQEDAKRSHLYDGLPIVIEGGPGTGKTTTMIQRLKFLIAPEAIEDYENPLSDEFKKYLLDPEKVDSNWLFISPTRQLLLFLRENMRKEGLSAHAENTKTIGKLREDMYHAYKLKNANSDGPFKLLENDEDEETQPLILDPIRAVKGFESFIVENIVTALQKTSKIKTSDFEWHNIAVHIKYQCASSIKIKDMDGLIRLFITLQKDVKSELTEKRSKLSADIEMLSASVVKSIKEDEKLVSKFINILDSYRNNNTVADNDVEEFEMEEEEDEVFISSQADDKTKIFNALKPVIKKLALQKYDNNKFSKKEEEIYDLLRDVINKTFFDEDSKSHSVFCKVGENAWFVKCFASLCSGIGNNIFNQLPRLYKLYRKSILKTEATEYNIELLKGIVKQENNKYLHVDEVDLFIGFVNTLLFRLYKGRKEAFDKLSHKYKDAYVESVKPVIGVDEATDYSLVDYYFINSFRHYDFSSVTLCGDIMQGLTNNGIERWSDLTQIFNREPKVVELRTSYRQLPTLVDMSREMYFDDQGIEAPYSSKKKRSGNDPKPLKFISSNEEEKALWLAKRIHEIYMDYNQQMPSVAIFVGEDEKVKKFIKNLKKHNQYLNGIKIEDCTENRQAEGTDIVRVFYLKEVKGMEFEVALFHNLDTSLENANSKLLRRYLYVGISRATTHLAATFDEEEGNKDIIKYFDNDANSWL